MPAAARRSGGAAGAEAAEGLNKAYMASHQPNKRFADMPVTADSEVGNDFEAACDPNAIRNDNKQRWS